MKTIIAIYGASGTGKSTTIIETYKMLLERIPKPKDPPDSDYDINEIIEYCGKKIGIVGTGDPNSDHAELIDEKHEANCDIILCASRTKGETVENIRKYYSNYNVIWSSNLYLTFSDKTMVEKLHLNKVFAKMLVELIDNLLNE